MSPAREHQVVAAAFTERVAGVSDWETPAPPEGWVARDVVDHLVQWVTELVYNGAGIVVAACPPVEADPVAAWSSHVDAVQALLDDPATAGTPLTDEHVGTLRLDEAIGQFYVPDVFLHTWDLARASGQDERLDRQRCARILEAMLPYDDALRVSGHYGPRVSVPPDADAQTKLLAFIGRTP